MPRKKQKRLLSDLFFVCKVGLFPISHQHPNKALHFAASQRKAPVQKLQLEKHNKGDVTHTAKYKPWRIKNAIAFENKEKAYAFEAYLKTHCGRAFIKRHF